MSAIEVLNDIRWNPNMAPVDQYRIGYMDRFEGLKWFKFKDIAFDKSDKFAIVVRHGVDLSHIPFHRLREIRRGDVVIWQRKKSSI